jgi:hypothetical protein
MKALYKCDFCDKIGTTEEIYEHEIYCENNPKRTSCSYCANKETKFINGCGITYTCNVKEIPEGCEYINCDKFTLKEMADISINDIFGGFLAPRR